MGSFLSTCKLVKISILKRESEEPPLPIKTKLRFLLSLQISWIFSTPPLYFLNFHSLINSLYLSFFFLRPLLTYLIWQTDNCYIIFMLFDGSFVKLFSALVSLVYLPLGFSLPLWMSPSELSCPVLPSPATALLILPHLPKFLQTPLMPYSSMPTMLHWLYISWGCQALFFFNTSGFLICFPSPYNIFLLVTGWLLIIQFLGLLLFLRETLWKWMTYLSPTPSPL